MNLLMVYMPFGVEYYLKKDCKILDNPYKNSILDYLPLGNR